LWFDNLTTAFAYSNQQTMIPSTNWIQATESVLVYSGEYPLITIKSYGSSRFRGVHTICSAYSTKSGRAEIRMSMTHQKSTGA
jgi:hypothetical protein